MSDNQNPYGAKPNPYGAKPNPYGAVAEFLLDDDGNFIVDEQDNKIRL